jgi:DNA (cytosine-5)-methyltransferase 1
MSLTLDAPAAPPLPTTTRLTALDLFAGTGWGVACQRLRIAEYGVELMPEAVATREANGMHTLYRDVWEGLEGKHDVPPHGLLIASPPCQTFSMAGGGKGREALDEVIALIDAKAYLDVADLRAFGEKHDMRTALVLTPLAHIARDVPMFVVLEQVPPVLPVWERYAVELRKWGYSVVTGILNAEQYGVPQTRRRAILIARADGVEARMPTPTHSRYYSRDPKRLDPGVLPWVSMAQALGWGMTERPYVSVASGTESGGGTDPAALGGSGARAIVHRERDAGRWLVSNYSANGGRGIEKEGSKVQRSVRAHDEPATTLTSKAGSMTWHEEGHGWGFTDRPAVTVGNAVGRGLIGGSGAKATVVEALEAGTFIPSPHGDGSSYAEATRITVDEAAALQGYPAAPLRVTEDEAAALQSYPQGFTWCGTRGKRFLQIGNAVPPGLAEAILKTFL